ncbi:MAG: (d)CMP kinase [Puniceicoccales bacterium]|jgi:cytidylate kinase|nr:(d)CMP kinase [Puniceicoccales bacterium]
MRAFLLALLASLPDHMAGHLDWGAFTTYGSFEDLRREQEREVLEERLGGQTAVRRFRRKGFVAVAIDGGAGSGKTSTARALAERCGYMSVSTGEHYRALTALFLREGIPADDGLALRERLRTVRPSTVLCGSRAQIALNGRTFSESELRSPPVTAAVPAYAAVPALRRFLHDYERQLPAAAEAAGFKGVVLEGRDIASTVLPNADLRVHLEVNLAERRQRRAREGLVDDVAGRDRQDQKQMEPPAGVWHLNGTDLSLEEVVELLCRRLREMEGP